MEVGARPIAARRYAITTEEKAGGATYTPKLLADFVARQIVQAARLKTNTEPLRVMDPAVGDGELLASLLEHLKDQSDLKIEVYGFETNVKALNLAKSRLKQLLPGVSVNLEEGNFLEFVLEHFGAEGNANLFSPHVSEAYDLIIANPPYVRTQIMGTRQAQLLAQHFGLNGRVDLYYAFLIGIAQVLKPSGIAGIIVSNRFMTTRSGAPVRAAIRERFNPCNVWDLGDTKLFEAAVLPAVLLLEGRNGHVLESPAFTSIYETDQRAEHEAPDPVEALTFSGVVKVPDGRHFRVQHGRLDTTGSPDAVWRIATAAVDAWLATVGAHSWGTFQDIGKVRVGVKTCADEVFIRSDWYEMTESARPELLRPLTTHHVARRFKPLQPKKCRHLLYPHEVANGRRCTVDLARYPRARAYMEKHRTALEGRKYVLDAGRQWYEIWVPQDPAAWDRPKLVFRDISEEPTFWIDKAGTVVNGDCYWIIAEKPRTEDLLWLAAAVGNSSFIVAFYDHRFHNKLYAGRRRFITQYVEQFPLPHPHSTEGRQIIDKAKAIYDAAGTSEAEKLAAELDHLVWKAFGLPIKEVGR